MKAKGTPAGFALGNATGDSSWTHWLLWAHGGKLVDAKNNVVINSPETIAALEYSKQLYETFIPGTLVVARPEQQQGVPRRPALAHRQRHLDLLRGQDVAGPEELKELANDIQHAHLPGRRFDGKPRELNLVFPMMIFKYTKYPNAAKEYLRFMMEKEQYVPWQEASIGYVCQPLAAYEKSAFWTADPKKTPYRDCYQERHAGRLRGHDGLRIGGGGRGLHHPEHGGGGGVGVEDAEGSGGAGAEESRALLQGITSRRKSEFLFS